MKGIKIPLAGVLSALIFMTTNTHSPVNLNNSVDSHKKQVVQAKVNEIPTDVSQVPSPQLPKATEPEVVQAVKPVQQTFATGHEDLMRQAGIPEHDWAAVSYIVSHESSWRLNAKEPHTGAYGLCQALPRVKMASAGDDYMTNPVTQLQWCSSYATTRYGGWYGAKAHWVKYRWW